MLKSAVSREPDRIFPEREAHLNCAGATARMCNHEYHDIIIYMDTFKGWGSVYKAIYTVYSLHLRPFYKVYTFV